MDTNLKLVESKMDEEFMSSDQFDALKSGMDKAAETLTTFIGATNSNLSAIQSEIASTRAELAQDLNDVKLAVQETSFGNKEALAAVARLETRVLELEEITKELELQAAGNAFPVKIVVTIITVIVLGAISLLGSSFFGVS